MPTILEAKAAKAFRSIRATFESAVKAYPPNRPYQWGRHTLAITRMCQRATETVESGGFFYGIVNCPPRHGKSDITSRRYGPWHLLRNPTHEVILATYGGALANDMSYDAREWARRMFPVYGGEVSLRSDREAVGAWRTSAGGGFYAVGLGGAITGRGAHILVIDDYFKSHEEAQSDAIKDHVWNNFRTELFTRLSPEGHAVLIVANRWGEDDLVGRIEREARESEDFPLFHKLVFPAAGEDGEWLFPERFTPQHYRAVRAAEGSYWWNSLYQQQPRPREGNMLRADRIDYVESVPGNITWVRFWDLASTEKERTSADPCYTVGMKLGLTRDPRGTPVDPIYHLWIADVRRFRKAAPARDREIKRIADNDGPEVRVVLETGGSYNDTFEYVKGMLSGRRTVKGITPAGDKVVRATPLEPIFEAGNVHVLRAEWNEALEQELLSFPNGVHDDQVDALSGGYTALKEFPGRPAQTRITRAPSQGVEDII